MPIGVNEERDCEIRRLRDNGITMHNIAKAVSLSFSSVHQSLSKTVPKFNPETDVCPICRATPRHRKSRQIPRRPEQAPPPYSLSFIPQSLPEKPEGVTTYPTTAITD